MKAKLYLGLIATLCLRAPLSAQGGQTLYSNGVIANLGVNLCGTVGGTANAITCSIQNWVGTFAYTDGDMYAFKPTAANTTGVTVAIGGAAAKTVRKQGGAAALVSGDLCAAQWAIVSYDATNDVLEMQSPSCNAPSSGITTTGSPANGNLTKFSGASSITNADLSGNVITSGTTVATVTGVQHGLTANKPTTGCTPGDLYVATDATLGQQIYENSGTGTCVWTQQLDVTSSAGGVIAYSGPALATVSGTIYCPAGGGGACSATESNVDLASSSQATITNLTVQLSAAVGAGNSVAITWRKAGVDQSSTCTISGASQTECQDSTHSFNVSQGDLLALKLVFSGTIIVNPFLATMSQFGTSQSGGTVNSGTAGQLAYYAANGTAVSSSSGLSSCAVLDNAICTSAVSSGNPNFLTTASNTTLPINGGTTPLVMFIGGVYQVLNTNVTLTVPSTTNVPQWILALQDTTNANMVAGDFLAMNTAPAYAYTAPICPSPSPSLSATNPAFWFDLSTNLSKTCTSNGGSYSAQASMVIGVVWIDATPKVLAVAMEPYRLNPYKRFEMFGNGTDGTLTITSGTTTIGTHKQYASVIISGGTLAHAAASAVSVGISFQSLNPVLVFNTGAISANSSGGTNGSAGTGAGTLGNQGGFAGSGGGGGGSGTTSAAGGGGGLKMIYRNSQTTLGGSAGAATPTAGGAGSAAIVESPLTNWQPFCEAASGGSGAGDGTNNGGSAGAGGGAAWVKAPSIVVDTGGSITANGGNGGNGAGGNAGGGGGGGGGCVILNGGYLFTTNGTVTASAGAAGSGVGTGQAGAAGGAGLVQINRLW